MLSLDLYFELLMRKYHKNMDNQHILHMYISIITRLCFIFQVHCRIFKSGPAEESIECQRHKSMRRYHPPLVRGAMGVSPRFFFNFESFLVRFLWFLSSWDHISVILVTNFARKYIPWWARNRTLGKIFFREARFSLFSLACFFDIISPMSSTFLA